MKKILVTGFDPFGGETVNPAFEAVRLLPDAIAGLQLVKLELPTVFGAAGERLLAETEAVQPAAVLCVGQAGGRAAITPEKVAINYMDGHIPDNAGRQPQDEPICPGGPDAYFTTLPVRRMAEHIYAAGIPAAVSYTAGTYVPYAMEQLEGKPAGTPGMELQQIARGLACAIEAIAEEL